MRAFGPGSVSSLLKTVLDVVFVALCAIVGALGLMALLALILSVSDPQLFDRAWREIYKTEAAPSGVAAAGLIFAYGLSFAGVLVIVRALRQIFTTLTAGDPFHPANVDRLRLIGVMLALLEVGRYLVWAVTTQMPFVKEFKASLNLTAWFSVLVVFVLAEVFREGARLRREAELTI